MYIMLTGYPPFNGEDDDSILRSVKTGKYDTTLDTYQKLSPEAKDLISKLLKYSPHERITARDALNHPWFKSHNLRNNNNTIDPNEVRDMLRNLENYKSDNMLKCAAIAYLVHQNTNIKQCMDASKLFFSIDLNHDGKLEKNELEYAYKKYCGLSEEDARIKAKMIFTNIDTAFKISSSLSPLKGGYPVSIIYIITPILHISQASSYLPFITSGAT